LAGFWQGRFAVWGREVEIVLEMSADPVEGIETQLHAPSQGISGVPGGTALLQGRELELAFPTVGARYEGRLATDGQALRGDWVQAGARFRLNLSRVEGFEGPPRPQEPSPPFPYRSDSVRFANPEAELTLAGTLTLPRAGGPFPGVVLVTGSGPQDRDETIFAHRPFLVLADALTRAGVAVLRYDDRGVGGSTGDFPSATTEDFASDALAAAAYLSRHPEIVPDRIGLIGHSEGGLVGPMVAVRSDLVAFLVLLAPPGMKGRDLVPLQTERILEASGVPEPVLPLIRRLQTALLDRILADQDSDRAGEGLQEELDGLLGGLPRDALLALGLSAQIDRAIDEQMRQLASPWIRFFLAFDPIQNLERVHVPVLALFGSKDLQVPATPNLELVRGALERGGNPDVTAIRLEGLNHLFQSAETGSPAEYGAITETISPVALDTITEWVRARGGRAVKADLPRSGGGGSGLASSTGKRPGFLRGRRQPIGGHRGADRTGPKEEAR
jgi:pimeloyl-ACP methyl ester carboxylesterase